jgi:Uma2 family endonuclease
MATAPTKLMTAEEFWDFVHRAENRDRCFELVRGEVMEMSLPGKLHGFVCSNIAAMLFLFARQRKKGYVCTNDTGFVVERDPDSVRGPDIMFFEDADSIEQIDRKWGATPPRLSVEVLSPHDSMSEMNERIAEQLTAGTPLLWLVDPMAHKVTIYRPDQQHYVLGEGDEITGEEVLPDLRCKVADFFKMPGQ